MPKLSHEALVQLVRNAPSIIPSLLWPERQVPAALAHITQSELVDLNLAEYRADAVIALGADPKSPVLMVVLEAQTAIDPRKRVSWPLYIAGVHARQGCDVVLVVVALDPEVAAWARQPISIGDGCMVVTPRVIGPESIPVITDIEVARRSPELAVLSVAAHADEPGAERIALAALAATHDLDNHRATLYPDLVFVLLGQVARAALEKLMATAGFEYQSDIARKWFAEGKAEMLLKLLDLKGIPLTDEERERVLGCHDVEQLDAWAARVLVAKTAGEIFGDA